LKIEKKERQCICYERKRERRTLREYIPPPSREKVRDTECICWRERERLRICAPPEGKRIVAGLAVIVSNACVPPTAPTSVENFFDQCDTW